MDIPILNREQILNAQKKAVSEKRRYRAMYSSWYGGIILEPEWMSIPIDDHLVHRGDGIFEALRVSFGAIYDLKAHLDRLQRSSDKIQLDWPVSRSEMESIIVQTVRAANIQEMAVVRLFISRGPGGFTTNPYESVGSQLYIVVTDYRGPSADVFSRGVSLGLSKIPAKENPWHEIKSCNYLQNVMMKKESVDLGFDFTVSINQRGIVCEGSTENFCIVNSQGEMKVPRFEYTLRGTTLVKVLGFAEKFVKEGLLSSVDFADLTTGDLTSAQEIFLVGTTLEVLSARQFENKPVGSGQPGAVSQTLRQALLADIQFNAESRTVY